MAIQRHVFYSPDRHLRITADSGNKRYRVERDLVLVIEFTSLAMLVSWLREQGLDLADLIED